MANIRLAYRKAGSAGNWKTMRLTSDSMSGNPTTVQSNESRSDRQKGGQKLVAVSAGGAVGFEFHQGLEDLIQAALCSTFDEVNGKTGIGTDVQKFDVLKSYMDQDKHVLFKNCVVNQLTLDMGAASYVTGSVDFLGEEVEPDYNVTAATFDPAPTGELFDTTNNLSQIKIDGAPVTTCITAMSLTINNNYDSSNCVGSMRSVNDIGDVDVTGSVTMRFSSKAYDLWKQGYSNTPIQLGYSLSDDTTGYAIDIKNAWLSGELPGIGGGTVTTASLNFAGSVDATGQTLEITRT